MTLITDIETIEVVRFKCDGYKCDEQSGWDLPEDEDQLITHLKFEGWTFEDDKCYCPECSERA